MITKNNYILSTLLFLSIFSFGQGNRSGYIPNVYPPTPNASSVAKNIESMPNMHSGTYSASIPIFNLSNGTAESDIVLNYNTKGVLLAEVASNIGIGWSLNYGGSLSRQVRDRPDDSLYGFYSIYNKSDIFQTNEDVRREIYSSPSFLSDCGDTCADLEPDIFYLNIGNFTTKFIVNPVTKKVILQSPSDLKIDVYFDTNNLIDKVKVIDSKGNTYHFGNLLYEEQLNVFNRQILPSINEETLQTNSAYRNAWMLNEIIDLNGNSIFFKYETEIITTFRFSDQKLSDNVFSTNSTRTRLKQNRIKEIFTDVGTNSIVFNYDKNREDIAGSKLLTSIVLKNNNEIIRKYELLTSKIEGSNQFVANSVLNLDPKANIRYYLDSFKEYGNNDNLIGEHSFYYYNKDLPNRHSKAIDLWGYYNGKTGNNLYNFLKLDKNIDRQVNLETLKNGTLNRIVTPTKGSIELQHELHSAIAPKYFNELYRINNNHDDNQYELQLISNLLSETGSNLQEYILELDYPELTFYQSFCVDRNGLCEDFMISVYSIDNRFLGSLYPTRELKSLKNIIFNKGTYKIRITAPRTPANMDVPFLYPLQFFIKKPINGHINSEILMTGGGLRIKELMVKDENGNVVENKKYEYTNNQNLTSGKLFDIPDYYYIIARFNIGNTSVYGLSSNLVGNPSPLSQHSGNGEVGYSEVKEVLTNRKKNTSYKSIYSYSNYYDGNTFYMFPMNVKDDLSWARGLLLSVNQYNDQGLLVRMEKNLYSFFNDRISPYISFTDSDDHLADNNPLTANQQLEPREELFFSSDYNMNKKYSIFPIYKFGKYVSNPNENILLNHNNYRVAFFYGSTVNKFKNIIEDYSNDKTFRKETNYKYNTDKHLQLTSETTTNSKGETTTTEYQYPPDRVGDPIAEALTAKNRIAEPLIIRQKVGDMDVSETYTQYQWFNNNTLLQKSAVFQKKGKEVQEKDRKITYNSYDQRGNITQYTPEGGLPVSIIWGYNGQYPVAKIEGVIRSTINGSILTNLENSTSLTTSSFDDLRSSIPQAMITSYTYQPLVGVTSITGPNKQTEYYHYDPSGRLASITNSKAEVLKTFNYHYSTN